MALGAVASGTVRDLVHEGQQRLDMHRHARVVGERIARYREAVRACWHLRTRRSLTLRQLAEEATLYASHVSDYVSADDAKRELPAKHQDAFEIACGNRVITQWDMARKHLTVLESLIEQRRAA